MNNKALIVAASGWDKSYIAKIADKYDYIAAVDGGAEAFIGAKKQCDILIGDFDSIDPKKLELFSKTKKLEYEVLKDKSDLELAIEHVLDLDFKEIHFSGVLGGRVSHELININIIEALFEKKDIRTVIREKSTRIEFLKDNMYLKLPKGLQVSFIPVYDKKSRISLMGFKWNLKNKIIHKDSSLTLSNVTLSEAYVKVKGAPIMVILEPLSK